MARTYTKQELDEAVRNAKEKATHAATKAEQKRCLSCVRAAPNYVEGDAKTRTAMVKAIVAAVTKK